MEYTKLVPRREKIVPRPNKSKKMFEGKELLKGELLEGTNKQRLHEL